MTSSKLYWTAILLLILLWSGFLLFYRLSELMPFIGDQAWFYLSARDIWLKGQIPLVGITSSHIWLHQGPLWTYLLAILLPLGKYHPVFPAYFTSMMSLITTVLLFFVASRFFSKTTGLIAAALFGTSPYIILLSRMPYHTTLIPFFTLLLYTCLVLWLKRLPVFFPLVFFFLGILYNLELATITLWAVPVLLLMFGWYKRTPWFKDILNKKILLLSLIGFLIPMLPVLIYDTTHHFVQTVVFTGWLVYSVLKVFLPIARTTTGHSVGETIVFFSHRLSLLIFAEDMIISLLILLGSTILFVRSHWSKKVSPAALTLGLFFLLGVLGFIANKTPSDAYLPMLFPFLFLTLAVAFASLTPTIWGKIGVSLFLLLMIVMNSWYLLSNNYLTNQEAGSGVSLKKRMEIAETIVKEANGNEYSLMQRGPGSQFPSSVMNTEYLTWYLGHPPVTHAPLRFVVTESPTSISVSVLK